MRSEHTVSNRLSLRSLSLVVSASPPPQGSVRAFCFAALGRYGRHCGLVPVYTSLSIAFEEAAFEEALALALVFAAFAATTSSSHDTSVRRFV